MPNGTHYSSLLSDLAQLPKDARTGRLYLLRLAEGILSLAGEMDEVLALENLSHPRELEPGEYIVSVELTSHLKALLIMIGGTGSVDVPAVQKYLDSMDGGGVNAAWALLELRTSGMIVRYVQRGVAMYCLTEVGRQVVSADIKKAKK